MSKLKVYVDIADEKLKQNILFHHNFQMFALVIRQKYIDYDELFVCLLLFFIVCKLV